MNRIKLTFGTYNNEPIGSTNDQLEISYKNSYRPFLKLLYAYPKIKASLHYSGILLEWFNEKHPEIISLLNEMVKRSQIELIGGPFYNPILSIIPNKDRISQIEYLTTYIRKHFGKRPRGCWIPEKIWEPTLSSNIKNSGMEYTFLDEDLFKKAGVERNKLNKVYITEDQGKHIHVFPINKELSMDFIEPENIIELLLKNSYNDDSQVFTIMIDGGEHIIGDLLGKNGWFEKLFIILTEQSRKIQTINPGRYIRTLGAVKKIYFPCSTNEMYFRQNFTRYIESNLLYSKMMYMNTLASQVKRDKVRKKNAREEILMSQCNAPYWHKDTPGIYDNNLRKTAYKHLINAEKSTREKGIFTTSLSKTDFDFDGEDEFLYQGQYINAYVHKKGAVLFELDYLLTSWNYLDTMTRYREIYHLKEHEANGFDWYSRNSFIDHFLEDNCKIEDFSVTNYKELGSFVDSEYSLEDLDREKKTLVLDCSGSVLVKKIRKKIKITKHYIFKKNSIQVFYKIKNLSDEKVVLNFASELNLSLNNPEDLQINGNVTKDNQLKIENDAIDMVDGKDIVIHDVKKKVTISISSTDKFSLWEFPVKTLVKKFDKIESIYQSSCFVLRWPVTIEPAREWSNSIVLKIGKK
ncbi:MAG: 4-alpha-glucanotransferase [Bacteroidetes bacterium]|nr:MAG: 4-alpha-glucanotransferase [Bacteroidota bacterium]